MAAQPLIFAVVTTFGSKRRRRGHRPEDHPLFGRNYCEARDKGGCGMAWWRKKRTRVSRPPAQRGPSVYSESPDMTTMTQGVTFRAGGLGFDETVGMASGGAYLDAAAAGAVTDRSLHAVGKTCPRCGRAFTEDDPVRRTPTGEFVHDVC